MSKTLQLTFQIKSNGQAELDRLVQSVRSLAQESRGASGLVDKFGRSISTAASDVGAKSGKGFGEAEKAAGRLQNQFRDLADSVRANVQNPMGFALNSVKEFAMGAGLAGGVALVAGAALGVMGKQAFDLVRSTGEAAERTVHLADRLGLTAGQAKRLELTSRLASVEVGSLEGSSRYLALALEDSSGAGEKAADALKRIGVETYGATGEARDMGAVLFDTLEKLSEVPSASGRIREATAILGRGSKELIPLIARYDEMRERLKELGITFDSSAIQKAAEAEQRFKELDIAFAQLRKSLSAKIEPIVIPIVQVFRSVVAGTASGIAGSGGSMMSSVGTPIDYNSSAGLFGQYDRIGNLDALLASRFSVGGAGQAEMNRLAGGGQSAAAAFRAKFAATTEGKSARLAQLQAETSKMRGALSSGAMMGDSAAIMQADYDKSMAELRSLEKELSGKKDTGMLTADYTRPAEKLRVPPSLYQRGDTFQMSPLDSRLGRDVGKMFGKAGEEMNADALRTRMKEEADTRARMQEGELAHRIRMVELQTGPNGELAAAKRVFDLRMESARSEEERQKARYDFEERTIELQRKAAEDLARKEKERIEQYREAAGKVFDAMLSKGDGLRSFFKAEASTLGRIIFQNISAEMLSGAGSRLALPGTMNSQGGLTPLGRVLKGTPFGAGAKVEATQEANTRAEVLNTIAVEKLTTALRTGAFGGGIGELSGGAMDALMVADGNRNLALAKMLAPAAPRTGWSTGKMLGAGAVMAGGAFGVYQGIKTGGAQGDLMAGGSVAGMAGALLPMLSKSLAVAGPIGMAAGIGLSIAASLMGDPKVRRSEEMDNLISRSQKATPESRTYTADAYGRGVDYDYQGGIRVIQQQTVKVEVKAMDSKSFTDHYEDIGNAVRLAIQKAHPVLDEARQALSTV